MINRFFVFAVVLVAASCGNSNSTPWEPPPQGFVVVESTAPDGSLKAVVVAGEQAGHYVFEVRDSSSQASLASREISAPIGYHLHGISLSWPAGESQVIATIDHDFGESNLKFELAY